MPSPKYPLQPLLEHRERAVDDATAELGNAVRRREGADAARARTESERRAAEQRAADVKREEAERLARGELRVVDLVQGASWEASARGEIAALTRAVEAAEHRVSEARAQEVETRGELARTMADRDVVAKDESRFEEQRKKAVLAAEEEAAEEVFGAGQRARGR